MSTQNVHTNVYRSLIHNCQIVEAIKMSFSWETDKLWYVYTMEYYSVVTKMSCQAMKRHCGNFHAYCYVKEANLKRLHMYDSNYMIFWKRENQGDCKKVTGWQGVKVGSRARRKDEQVEHRGFFRAMKLFCMIYCNGVYMSLYIY